MKPCKETAVPGIAEVDLARADIRHFKKHLADCIVLARDGRILLQHRPDNWGASAGFLTAFGGHVEPGETIMQGLLRELAEELGAAVDPGDVVFIGAVSEQETGHSELVHVHFWHDRTGTVTGCYEAEPRYYANMADALTHPKVMDYLRWALLRCAERGLIA